MNYNAIDNICSGIEIMMRTKSEFGAPLVLAMAAEELIREQLSMVRLQELTDETKVAIDWGRRCADGLVVGFLLKMKMLKEAMHFNLCGPEWLASAKRIVAADDMVKHSRV